MGKINIPQLVCTAGITLVIVCGALVGYHFITAPKDSDEIKYEEGDTLPSGAIATDEKGGTASLTLSTGETVSFTVPNNMYNVKSDYLALVTTAYGLNSAAESENLIVLGSDNNVYASKDAITATTFSALYDMFGQIYGDAWTDIKQEDIYPPVYLYMTSGEIPETPYENYSIEELDSITAGDITYRAFKQEYDATSNDEEGNEITEHVVQLAAYSDSEDVIEIIVDEENKDIKTMHKMLEKFVS